MRVLLDIKDNKAASLLEVLNDLPFVKVTHLSKRNAKLVREIKEAVENLDLVRRGKMKARPAEELLAEL